MQSEADHPCAMYSECPVSYTGPKPKEYTLFMCTFIHSGFEKIIKTP